MADLTLKSGTPTGNPPAGYIKLFIGDDGRLTGRDSTGASTLALSGVNTGDQTITLTGDVTGSGSGSFAATIAAGSVSNAKQAQMPALTLKGNASGSAAAPSDLTIAQARTLLGAGSGNGFDADTVDGQHAAAFAAAAHSHVPADVASIASGTVLGRTTGGTGPAAALSAPMLGLITAADAPTARTSLGLGTAATANTGAGNNLDADSVDGVHAATLQAGNFRSLVTNGCCRVSHRASKALSTSWQTGPVDLIAVAAGGTVSAGTIVQASGVTSLSKSGYACQVQSATLTGAGTISWRHRIEARNAIALANGAAMVTARTYHDVGVSVTYTITVNKPTAADNFSSVTQIATGTVSVANATNADLSLAVGAMGDCSNGIEIITSAACGAITTKNFYLGDLQLVAGSLALPMMLRPVAVELALVARYLRPCVGLFGKANSTTNIQAVVSHPDMRTTPAYEATAALVCSDGISTDFTQSQISVATVEANVNNGRVNLGYFTGLTSGTVMLQKGTGGTILASAEL
ncbi:MAG: hypothetical protein WCF85_14285 [Rhodospirillaceae bacterium]